MVFLTGPPNFSTKKKTANQPTTAAVPENPVTKKGRDWLLSDFLFGTEVKKTTLYVLGLAMQLREYAFQQDIAHLPNSICTCHRREHPITTESITSIKHIKSIKRSLLAKSIKTLKLGDQGRMNNIVQYSC